MAAEESVRVILVDDHELLRRGIKTMLESESDIEVVGEASDGTQVLELVEKNLPDVVLIDVIMPNKDGIETTREIKDTFPNVGVVVLSGHDDQQFVFDALKAGASGYLLKTADLEEVISTVRVGRRRRGQARPHLALQVLSEFQNYQKDESAEVYPAADAARTRDPPADERRAPEQDDRDRACRSRNEPSRLTSRTSTRSCTSTTAFRRSRKRCVDGS